MRDLTTSDKSLPECLDQLFEAMYGPFPQTIEPSHHRGPEARWEYLAHQPIVLGILRHHLNIMADVFHRVGFAIVASERWAIEMP